MKKKQFARRLARRAGVSAAEAADHLDCVVHDIVSRLRQGKAVPLPGLGRLKPSARGIAFEPEGEPRGRC